MTVILHGIHYMITQSCQSLSRDFLSFNLLINNNNNNNNNNTQIAAIVLPPSTTHPQLWAELLTFKPKCTIA